MSRTLTISDKLYEWLETHARSRGLTTEQLLDSWRKRDHSLHRRQEANARIEEIERHLYATYGEMPDSVPFLRDDRAR